MKEFVGCLLPSIEHVLYDMLYVMMKDLQNYFQIQNSVSDLGSFRIWHGFHGPAHSKIPSYVSGIQYTVLVHDPYTLL